MRTLNWKKIISIVAFIALAGFSCYWTAESLYIWQPSITIYGALLIAIVFYIVASICFSRFVKSFQKYGDFGYGIFDSRGGHLFFGLTGLIVFWLLFSLPTNTHTLLYRASIKEIVKTDVERTQSYLMALKDNNVGIKRIENQFESRQSAVAACIERLRAEADNPERPGIGDRFNNILIELETILRTPLTRMSHKGNTRSGWNTVVEYYNKQAKGHLDNYKIECNRKIDNIKKLMKDDDLRKYITDCGIAKKELENMDGEDQNKISQIVDQLGKLYPYIGQKAEYIQFRGKDKERYTREGAIPESKEMASVFDVWKDYLTTDKYKGHGFIWWVIIALLIDLAAFVFFNLAIGKDD